MQLIDHGALSAAWATSVGNERGEIVICVIAAAEDNEALSPMAHGLIKRYTSASVPPPSVLCGLRLFF